MSSVRVVIQSIVLASILACFTEQRANAQQPIGLTELDLMVHRTATSFDAYKQLPQLSDKARRILLFEPGVVQVIASPSDVWQYRSASRTLIMSPVDNRDYDALAAILVSSLFDRLYRIISQQPRTSGLAATMSLPVFYQKMYLELAAVDSLAFSANDKARLRQAVGEAIVDHPTKGSPEQLSKLPPEVVSSITSARKAATEHKIKRLLSPNDVPVASDAESSKLWAEVLSQLKVCDADGHDVHIEPNHSVPNVFKFDLGDGQRLLLTMGKDAASSQRRSLKPKELLELLDSNHVKGLHLDTVDGEVLAVPERPPGARNK